MQLFCCLAKIVLNLNNEICLAMFNVFPMPMYGYAR